MWQNEQVSVQPTWDEMHNVPRSSSGMNTVSASLPSSNRSSHLIVPSELSWRLTTRGREILKLAASRARIGFARLVIRSKSTAPR